MRIISYEFSDETWSYTPVTLNRTNLLVGSSGSGKTKFLNTIFNLASFIRKNDISFSGNWKLQFSVGRKEYLYEYAAQKKGDDPLPQIVHERLAVVSKARGDSDDLILRSQNSLVFNGRDLPRLSQYTPAVNLLQNEPKIKPVFDAFGRILRRNFFADALSRAVGVPIVQEGVLENLAAQAKKDPIIVLDWPLALQLWFMNTSHKDKFAHLVSEFQSIFPNILDLKISMEPFKNQQISGQGLSVNIEAKERGVRPTVPLQELSSGMQKVLVIMCDALLMPKEGIYLIDEYENSLGINAINFLPTFIAEYAKDMQLLITTHHEYLINKIPVQNWLLFSRDGANVTIRNGLNLKEKFKSSRQDAFTQLINDPLYSLGPK